MDIRTRERYQKLTPGKSAGWGERGDHVMDPLWFDRERVDREIPSIDFNALTFDNDLGVYCHQGEPFTGVCTQRYPDGKLMSLMNNAEGLAMGVTAVWHPNGQIHLYSEMLSDTLHGLHVEWDKDGTKTLEEHYRRGQLIVP